MSASPPNSPETKLERYRVGGSVRDQLLGLEPSDQDWVVVGSTPEEMRSLGFQPVGKDFPVFLHPDTKEEYALARGRSPDGALQFRPDVTLEEDLARRDLRINAMAMTADGKLIDPFHGQQDLKNRLLRHLPHFEDDPLRLLRLARLAAQLDFQVTPATCKLAGDMAANNQLDKIAPERQWQELKKALLTPSPRRFVEVLRQCRILRAFLPEIDELFGIPQPKRYHPEIDTGEHVLLTLDKVVALSNAPEVRFAVLLHDLGKAATAREFWPSHRGHEALGVPLVDRVCQRLRVPLRYQRLARKTARYHLLAHMAFDLKPDTVEKLLSDLDAWRNPDDFERFLVAAQADAQGRKGLQNKPYPQAEYLRQARQAAARISAADLPASLSGKKIGDAIHRLRCQKIAEIRKSFGCISSR